MRMLLLAVVAGLGLPGVAQAQFTAEAKCAGKVVVGDSKTLAVDAVNDAYYKAAGGRHAPKECELLRLTGTTPISEATGSCLGAVGISPSGHIGRAFRKCSAVGEAEAQATAEGHCRDSMSRDKENPNECSTFTGRYWLVGVRCREGEGKNGQLRFVGFADDKNLNIAITKAFRDGAKEKLKVMDCKVRTFHDASIGKFE